MIIDDDQPIKVKCEICTHVLGTVTPSEFTIPIMGSMFESIAPGQFPEPFPASATWEFMRCPMCRKRPFLRDDHVFSESGDIIWAIDPDAPGNLPQIETPESIDVMDFNIKRARGKLHGKKR